MNEANRKLGIFLAGIAIGALGVTCTLFAMHLIRQAVENCVILMGGF